VVWMPWIPRCFLVIVPSFWEPGQLGTGQIADFFGYIANVPALVALLSPLQASQNGSLEDVISLSAFLLRYGARLSASTGLILWESNVADKVWRNVISIDLNLFP
jgi:hypothetical protein